MVVPLWVIAGCQIALVFFAFRAARKSNQTPVGMTGELNNMSNTLNAETAAFEQARRRGKMVDEE